MIDLSACERAYQAGRRVVLDRLDAETRQRRAFRAYVDESRDADYGRALRQIADEARNAN
jgi:hypothetical protein